MLPRLPRICRRPAALNRLALLAAVWSTIVPAVADPADAPSPRAALVLAASYIGDSRLNARGGRQEGFAYVDNVEFAAHLDAQRAFGLRGLQFFASALHNNQATFSDTHVGDLTVASNIDTDAGLRLYEAWVDWSLPTARATSIRAGLYDLNSEFDTTESRSLFVNSAYGMGQDLAQTGENGPSAFPVNAFGARIAWSPRDTWLLEFAVLDGVPGRPGQPGQPGIDFSTSQGALLIAEATTSAGPSSQISIGHWRYTASR